MKNVLMLVLLIVSTNLFAKEPNKEFALTVRATELKVEPYSDAKTLLTLAENSKVEILLRQGSWIKIKSANTTGWLKMLSLRFGNEGKTTSDSSGLKSLFNLATTGSSGSAVTTGARGVDEEKLRNPHPNPQALQSTRSYAVGKTEAQKFADAEKLVAQNQTYLNAGENK